MAVKKPVKKKTVVKRQLLGGVRERLKSFSFGESRAYLFEYGLLLLVVGGIVGVLVSMLSSVVMVIGSQETSRLASEIYAVEQSILTISTGIVLLPLLLVLSRRTLRSETLNPLIKNTGWRKAFLGIFLATLAITAIGIAISHVNGMVSYLVLDNDSFDWRSQIGSGLTVLILGLTAWVIGSDYRHTPLDKYPGMRQRFYNSLFVGTLLVGLFFVVGPLAEQQRNVEKDIKNHHGYGDRCVDHLGLPEENNFMPKPILENY